MMQKKQKPAKLRLILSVLIFSALDFCATTFFQDALGAPLFFDTIFMMAALFAFVGIRELDVPIWAVFFILLRELLISTLRVIAALEGKVMAAERWGKFKTVIQMVTVGTIFFVLDVYHLSHLLTGSAQRIFYMIFITLCKVPYTMTAIAAVITWISAISYLSNNWDLLKKSWSLHAKNN